MCNALDLLTFWVMQARFAGTWSSSTSQQIMVFWKKSRGTWWKITVGLQQGNILVRSMNVFFLCFNWHWVMIHKSTSCSVPCCHDADLGILQEHRQRSVWMCHLFLLQGKHPHHPQSSPVVTLACYILTELGNLPGDAENTAVSKPSTMSCGGEWVVAWTCNSFGFSHLLKRSCRWAGAFL